MYGVTDAGFRYLAMALALLPGIGVALGQGRIGASAVEAVARQPEESGKIMTNMILALGMTETAAIYGFVIAIMLFFA